MGILLEAYWIINFRINFSDKDINQIVDLSGLLFFLTIVYVFVNYGANGIYKILELLPFTLFLILLIQRYSPHNTIKTSALFLSIRRLGKDANDELLYEIDISMPYLFMCLISASSGHKENTLFFIACAVMFFWIGNTFRPKHIAFYKWALPVCIAFLLAFVTQTGIKRMHSATETFFMSLIDHYGWRSSDPDRKMTAIGQLGRLKLSDRILMRVHTKVENKQPVYLQELTYSKYEYGIWSNPATDFNPIQKTSNKKEWILNRTQTVLKSYDVGIYMQDQSAITAIPTNTQSLTGQDLVQIETNENGVIRIDAREGWINYRLKKTTDELFYDGLPNEQDSYIYDKYKDTFKTLADELELDNKTHKEVITTIQRYFADNFYYSPSQNQRYPKGKYLEHFLFDNKRGHCEYFATATTLLLREAGIPARYTVGYVMSEYSDWEDGYLIRGRDAHSWVQYYLDGKWRILDTTPAVWAPMESADSTFLEPIYDFFSWLRYIITSEDIDASANDDFNFAWLLIPLALYLIWSFSRKERLSKQSIGSNASNNVEIYGTDSPFYELMDILEKKYDARRPAETLSQWIKRILPDANQLYEIIALHYRYRFSLNSNKQTARQELISKVNEQTMSIN